MAKFFQHSHALVSPKAKIGAGTRIWAFTNVQDDVVIGDDCNICDACFIEKGVVIGNQVTLKNGVHVFDGITLEDNIFCGANVSFINDRYPRSQRKDWVLEKTLVKKGSTIGSNATILCGITLGEYSFVAAGSVVTKNVAPHVIVAGNPAVARGYACRCGRKLPENLKCACSLQYVVQNNILTVK